MKKVWNYVGGIYLLFYSIASIAIFVVSAKYLFFTFSLYAALGLSIDMDRYVAVIDGMMCLQLLLTFFSGIIGIFAFIKRISGKWLIASGCFGIASKVVYMAARLASLFYGKQFIENGFSTKELFNCCLPMVYIPFCIAVLAIGIGQLKKEETFQCRVWFPFFYSRGESIANLKNSTTKKQ